MRRYELSKISTNLLKTSSLITVSAVANGKNHIAFERDVWVMNSGAQWREMPERYGSWKTVYDRFNRWSRDGTLEKMLSRLHLKLDENGYIDMAELYVDSTNVSASCSTAGAQKRPAGEPVDHTGLSPIGSGQNLEGFSIKG